MVRTPPANQRIIMKTNNTAGSGEENRSKTPDGALLSNLTRSALGGVFTNFSFLQLLAASCSIAPDPERALATKSHRFPSPSRFSLSGLWAVRDSGVQLLARQTNAHD